MPGKRSAQQEPQALDDGGQRRHGQLVPGVEIVCQAIERHAERMPALEHGLGQRNEGRRGLSARARPPQHDRAAELGDGLAGQAGVVMDSGELVRGEADVELVLARIVSARSRHAEKKTARAGRAGSPRSRCQVFASKNPACSPLLLRVAKTASRLESLREPVRWSRIAGEKIRPTEIRNGFGSGLI